MNDLSHRFALIVLAGCGLLTIAVLPLNSNISLPLDYSRAVVDWNMLQTQHWRFVLGILGGGLIVCAFVPALRPAAISAALLSKLAFLRLALADGLGAAGLMHGAWLEAAMVVALLAAAAILAGEAWQEARWNGMLRCPWRSDARSAG